MKTMMSLDGTKIERVSDEKASRLFEEGYRYIAKSIWKEKVRDTELKLHDEVQDGKLVSEKSNKMSKAAKRQKRKSNK